MKPASQDSGDETRCWGCRLTAGQCKSVGGAEAPTQQTAHALQYELLAQAAASDFASGAEVGLA